MSKLIIDIPDDFTYTAGDTSEGGFIKAVLDYHNYSCIWGFHMKDYVRIEEDE